MRSRTVIFSLIVHAAIAATLLGAAGKKAGRKATQVVLAEEKKKAKPAPPKPPPPPTPRATPKPVEHKVAAVTKTVAEPVARVAAPVAVAALTMTNDDGPGGIALAPAPKAAAAASAAKVASAVTEARKQRVREAAAAPGEEAPCTEEPSKPVPTFKQDPEYPAAARAEGLEGKMKLRLTIGLDGAVTDVAVLQGLSPEFDAAIQAQFKQWRFKPAMACGKPVAGGTYLVFPRFELGD